jgi:hypothetical protein
MKLINMQVTIFEFDDETHMDVVKPHGIAMQVGDDVLIDTLVQNMAAQIAREIRTMEEEEE